MQARQGDLFFQTIRPNDIPKEASAIKDGIIARGETTGHAHKLLGAILLLHAGRMYIRAQQKADIVHEEHGTVTLPEGCYVVTRQREYIPQGWRQVAD